MYASEGVAFSFLSDNKLIAYQSPGNILLQWNLKQGEFNNCALEDVLDKYSSLATFSSDGKLLVTSYYDDHTARIWDTSSGALIRLIRTLKRHSEPGLVSSRLSPRDTDSSYLIALKLSPDGKVFASASSSGFIDLWGVENGTLLAELPFDIKEYDLTISPNSQLFACKASGHEITSGIEQLVNFTVLRNTISGF